MPSEDRGRGTLITLPRWLQQPSSPTEINRQNIVNIITATFVFCLGDVLSQNHANAGSQKNVQGLLHWLVYRIDDLPVAQSTASRLDPKPNFFTFTAGLHKFTGAFRLSSIFSGCFMVRLKNSASRLKFG